MDPANTEFQRDLSISYEKVGRIQLNLDQTDLALKNFKKSLEIAQILVELDPDNTEFQRDIIISNFTIGELFKAVNNKSDALSYFEAAREQTQNMMNQGIFSENDSWMLETIEDQIASMHSAK